MKYFFPYIRFLFLGVFAGAMVPHFSLDAMSCSASFILQKKSKPDSVIMKEHILINPVSKHKMPMVSMIREYGGWHMANFLAENIQKTMQKSFDTCDSLTELKLFDIFSFAINSINKVIEKSPDKNVHNTAATALIIVFTGSDELLVANVGSCRAVVFSNHKKKSYLTFLNKPHVAMPLLGGVFPVLSVFGYPELLLGSSKDTNYKDILKQKPDIFSYAIKKNDKLLILASYEVFDILSQKEVENICQNTSDPNSVCCALKIAVQKALDEKNIVITTIALYVINLSMQKECDVLMSLEDIHSTFSKAKQEIVDCDNKKVLSMKKIFRKFEVFLSSTHVSDIDDKVSIIDRAFTILKSWYYTVQLGQYSDSAMLQKLVKEIEKSFAHLLGAVQVSEIGTFLSNEQAKEISLWRSQFNPDYFN